MNGMNVRKANFFTVQPALNLIIVSSFLLFARVSKKSPGWNGQGSQGVEVMNRNDCYIGSDDC